MVILQLLSPSLAPSPVSDALITTPVLCFVSHLLSKYVMTAGDALLVAGLDSPLGKPDSVAHAF